jgi:exonuclease SbcC
MNDTKNLYENDSRIKINKNKILELNLLLEDLKFNQDRFNVLINEVPDFKTESEKNLLLLTQAEQRIRENQVTVNTLENDSVIIKNQIEALERNITTINHDIDSLNIKPGLAENIDLSLDDLKKTLMLKQNSFEFLISKEKYLDETLSNNKDLYLKSEDLKFLELSFSRNGIQALIIENVLPSLELEANKLLSYLTENQLSINLQIRKGRRLKNTEDYSQEIDIIIGDENGAVREYETYSGGESFRIDFAIRIALSRLVSLRSGVRSPILFIDEGFGSQDQIGQDRLREAIQEVSNSENYKFKKIIVITHLDSLKESFGVALEVSKNESSSYFSLN